MQIPCIEDFMECFGMEPIEKDPEMAYLRYIKTSDDGAWGLDFSFSGIMRSFQVVFRHAEKEIGRICSERTKKVEIRMDKFSSGVHVEFEISGCTAEANIILDPYMHCNWSILMHETP